MTTSGVWWCSKRTRWAGPRCILHRYPPIIPEHRCRDLHGMFPRGDAAEQMLLPVLPRRGAKDTGERDSLQLLTAMGSRARVTTSPSFVSALTAYSIFSHCCLKFPGGSRTLTVCRMGRI